MKIQTYNAHGSTAYFVADEYGLPLSQAYATEEEAVDVSRKIEEGQNPVLFIKCAAINGDDGRVWSLVPPMRHWDIVEYMRQMGYQGSVDRPGQQGFLLSNNNFCNRLDAYEIAEKAGQIKMPIESGRRLTTEHLW